MKNKKGEFKLPKISLIMAVYNAERYLKQALESVLSQTFKDFELIAINDGSKDSSLEILKEYENKFDNFKIINQTNKGVGPTKNLGLEVATGDYVTFLDSDDFITPDYLENLYKLAVNNDVDISCCGFNLFSDRRLNLPMPFMCRPGIYSSKNALKKIILDVTMHSFFWGKLYKRTLFTDNNIKFLNMYFEDLAASPRVFFYAKKVAVTNKSMYYYRRHRSSIVSSMNSDQINDLAMSVGILRNFLEEKKIYRYYKHYFNLYALRIEFQVFCLLLYKHTVSKNFTDFSKNFKKAIVLFNLFMSKNFNLMEDPTELPFYLVVPAKKVVKKSKV